MKVLDMELERVEESKSEMGRKFVKLVEIPVENDKNPSVNIIQDVNF